MDGKLEVGMHLDSVWSIKGARPPEVQTPPLTPTLN